VHAQLSKGPWPVTVPLGLLLLPMQQCTDIHQANVGSTTINDVYGHTVAVLGLGRVGHGLYPLGRLA